MHLALSEDAIVIQVLNLPRICLHDLCSFSSHAIYIQCTDEASQHLFALSFLGTLIHFIEINSFTRGRHKGRTIELKTFIHCGIQPNHALVQRSRSETTVNLSQFQLNLKSDSLQ